MEPSHFYEGSFYVNVSSLAEWLCRSALGGSPSCKLYPPPTPSPYYSPLPKTLKKKTDCHRAGCLVPDIQVVVRGAGSTIRHISSHTCWSCTPSGHHTSHIAPGLSAGQLLAHPVTYSHLSPSIAHGQVRPPPPPLQLPPLPLPILPPSFPALPSAPPADKHSQPHTLNPKPSRCVWRLHQHLRGIPEVHHCPHCAGHTSHQTHSSTTCEPARLTPTPAPHIPHLKGCCCVCSSRCGCCCVMGSGPCLGQAGDVAEESRCHCYAGC